MTTERDSTMTLVQVRHRLRSLELEAKTKHSARWFREMADAIDGHLNTGDAVVSAGPNEDMDITLADKHHLFIYEVDFGDEGKGRYIRLRDFNTVVSKLESLASRKVAVPDERDLSLCVTEYQRAFDQGFNSCRQAVFASQDAVK